MLNGTVYHNGISICNSLIIGGLSTSQIFASSSFSLAAVLWAWPIKRIWMLEKGLLMLEDVHFVLGIRPGLLELLLVGVGSKQPWGFCTQDLIVVHSKKQRFQLCHCLDAQLPVAWLLNEFFLPFFFLKSSFFYVGCEIKIFLYLKVLIEELSDLLVLLLCEDVSNNKAMLAGLRCLILISYVFVTLVE